ncbi:MAG: hypothetical protein MZV70_19265 [Desulfobacterales bacterium]|nr:hypothetical protein [Desulfobacterales bacterium]
MPRAPRRIWKASVAGVFDESAFRGGHAGASRVPDKATYRSIGFHAQDAWETANRRLRFTGALRYSASAYRSKAENSPAGVAPLWPDDEWSGGAWSGRSGRGGEARGDGQRVAELQPGLPRAEHDGDLGTLGLQGNGFFEVSAKEVEGAARWWATGRTTRRFRAGGPCRVRAPRLRTTSRAR